MKSNTDIIKEFVARKAQTDRGLSLQRQNSSNCDAFVAGDTMDYQAELDYPFSGRVRNKRVQIRFSKVIPYINAVAGFMIQNARASKFVALIPNKEEQEVYSNKANGIAKFLRKKAAANDIEDDQKRQMLIKGYGASEMDLSYGLGYGTRDPNGEIVMGDVTDEVGWDPKARRRNLVDARWVFYHKIYALDDAKVLFDDSNEDDFEDMPKDDDKGYRYDPYIAPYDRSKLDVLQSLGYDWDNITEQTIKVYFYQWQEYETFWRADNPLKKLQNPLVQQLALSQMQTIAEESEQFDDMFKFNPEDPVLTFNDRIKTKLTEMFKDLLEPSDYSRTVFYTAVLSGKKVFKSFRSISQNGFSVKFMTGIWDNRNKIWTGMVNPMMEPARVFDKAFTELMYLIAMNSKGGYFVEEDAVKDIEAFEADVNKTDGVVELLPGGLAKVQSKKTPFSPSGYDAIIQMADTAISDASGVDPTFLGSSENKLQTAQLQRQIVSRVMSTLAGYFKSDISYQDDRSRFFLDLMKVYVENNDGKMVRYLGDDNEDEFIQLSSDVFAPDYDVDIVEAPKSAEEKQDNADMLSGMATQLFAVQHPAAPIVLGVAVEDMSLDQAKKNKIIEALMPKSDPQVDQLKQQIEQLTNKFSQAQLEGQLMRNELDHARIDKERATIEKTMKEAEQIGVETMLAPLASVDKISVSV